MNKEQPFLDAILKFDGGLIHDANLAQVITEDKTGTLKKYMKSYGMLQLAYYFRELQEQYFPKTKRLVIDLKSSRNRDRNLSPTKPASKKIKYDFSTYRTPDWNDVMEYESTIKKVLENYTLPVEVSYATDADNKIYFTTSTGPAFNDDDDNN